MKTYNVSIYHFSDNSVYVAPRTDERKIRDIVRDCNLRPDVHCPMYTKSRSGMLESIHVVKRGLTKSEANRDQKALIRYFKSLGREVNNVRV